MAFAWSKLTDLNPFAGGGMVAVDFGGQTLKVLQITGGDSPHLTAAGCVQTPPELTSDPAKRLDFQFEQLPTLLKSAGVKAKRAVCAIPCAQMVCKHVQVTPEGKQTVGDAARLAVAMQLGCDPSALAMRDVLVENTSHPGGKLEVIAQATAASIISRLMSGLRSAKLEPVGMQTEFEAAVNAFRPVNKRDGDDQITTLYLDIGSSMTKVAIAHGSRLVFAKGIALGGRFLDAVVAKQSGCSITQARSLRMSLTHLTRQPAAAQAGDSGGMAHLAAAMRKEQAETATAVATPAATTIDAVTALAHHAERTRNAVDLTEQLRALTDEIALCVRYHESLFPERKVHRTIFLGGESRHVALCQHIARVLKTPAHAADPLARLARNGNEQTAGVDMNQPQPGWAIPMGLLMAPTDL